MTLQSAKQLTYEKHTQVIGYGTAFVSHTKDCNLFLFRCHDNFVYIKVRSGGDNLHGQIYVSVKFVVYTRNVTITGLLCAKVVVSAQLSCVRGRVSCPCPSVDIVAVVFNCIGNVAKVVDGVLVNSHTSVGIVAVFKHTPKDVEYSVTATIVPTGVFC